MGNILYGEEKLPQHNKADVSYEKSSHGIVWIDDQCGYRQPNSNGDHHKRRHNRIRSKRNVSFSHNDERREIRRPRSHSLDAIIEELYLSGTEETYYQGHSEGSYFADKKAYIPRVKLTRNSSSSSVKNEEPTNPVDMSRRPQVLHIKDSATTSRNPQIREKKKSDPNLLNSYRDEQPTYYEIPEKHDENYFTKNFDECMKRLQLIEKEHELIEKDERNIQFYSLKKPSKRQMTPTDNGISPPDEGIDINGTKDEEEGDEGETSVKRKQSETLDTSTNRETDETEKSRDRSKSLGHIYSKKEEGDVKRNSACPGLDRNSTERYEKPLSLEAVRTATEDATEKKNDKEPKEGWYSNLKKQFEKQEHETEDQSKTKEMSCRITGATLKNLMENQKSAEKKDSETRHYFSRLVRSNKSLIDEELPDPDKVQNIRAMFQENLNSTLKRHVHKLGGSLQNISTKAPEHQLARPMSVQGSRTDSSEDFSDKSAEAKEGSRPGSVKSENEEPVQVLRDELELVKARKLELTNIAKKAHEKELESEKNFKNEDIKTNLRNKRHLQPKWTDTGSVSSGVSSDFSSYDTDADCCSREGIEQDEVNTTDEELHDEVDDKHYVQNEILEKIRSFGTSVTYYGGQMITCSVGPLVSPTTQAIMEEIGQKYPNSRTNITRTFDEFYRKYVETNESARKKKVGRTRSFGQNDVFQKPNVLRNTEIDLYKTDLETEFGIRKPTGKALHSIKTKLIKSNSLGSRLELSGREEVEKKLKQITDPIVEISPVEKIERRVSIPKPETIINEQKPEENKEKQDPPPPERKESTTENKESKPKEILFGYEKNLLSNERKLDMEFEEFEVCETIAEKLDKLDGKEEASQDYRITIRINQDEPATIPIEEKFEEIIVNDQDPLDSLEIYLKNNEGKKSEAVPKRKWNIDLNKEEGKLEKEETDQSSKENEVVVIVNQVTLDDREINGGGKNAWIDSEAGKNDEEDPLTFETKSKELPEADSNSSTSASESGFKGSENLDNDSISSRDITRSNQEDDLKGLNCNGRSHSKYNTSKWPIETTVMVDIQKNEEQTPKLVSNGKSLVKTKIRLF